MPPGRPGGRRRPRHLAVAVVPAQACTGRHPASTPQRHRRKPSAPSRVTARAHSRSAGAGAADGVRLPSASRLSRCRPSMSGSRRCPLPAACPQTRGRTISLAAKMAAGIMLGSCRTILPTVDHDGCPAGVSQGRQSSLPKAAGPAAQPSPTVCAVAGSWRARCRRRSSGSLPSEGHAVPARVRCLR